MTTQINDGAQQNFFHTFLISNPKAQISDLESQNPDMKISP